MSEFIELPGGRLLSIPAWTFGPIDSPEAGTCFAVHPDVGAAVVIVTDQDAAMRHCNAKGGDGRFAPIALTSRWQVAQFLRHAMSQGVNAVVVDPSLGTVATDYKIERVLQLLDC